MLIRDSYYEGEIEDVLNPRGLEDGG